MRTQRNSTNHIRNIADRILVGDIKLTHSNVTGTSDPLARAFVFLTGYLGMPTKPVDDAHLFESSDKIEYLASEQGVGTYTFYLDEGWDAVNVGSFLTKRSDGTPIAVVSEGAGYYEADPLTGKLTLIDKKKASELGPEAIALFPEFRKGQFGRFLITVVRDAFGDFLLFALFSVICAGLSILLPAVFAYMVNTVISYEETVNSYVLSAVLFCLLIMQFCLQVVVNRVRLRLQTRIQSKTYFSYTRNVLKLSSGSMRRITGRIISLTMPFIDAAEAFTGSVIGFVTFLIQCVFALISVNLYATESRESFMIMVAVSFICCIIIMLLRYRVKNKNRDREEKLTGLRKEIIENNESIKSYGTEDVMYYRHSLFYTDYLTGNMDSATLQQVACMFTTLLSSLGVYFAILIKLQGSGDHNLGAISALFSAISLFCSYFGMMVNSLMEIADEIPQLKLMEEISSMPDEPDDDHGIDVPLKGRIECSHLNFSYGEDQPNVIRDLSFEIEAGEYVGIVGTSGCGKSTLLRLLMGFETPSDGSITYDGIDLQAWNLRALRKQFGVVLQDTAVMTGMISDNIAGISHADIEDIREAARKAAILDDIEAMPMKFNTLISSESENISGGQKQRILLARAILPNPRIMFLDEATSALDNISQKKVLESLNEMKVTRMVIAHRLSTVRECDRIFVMDKGQIAEQGSYSELMEKGGLFKKLVERDMA